jgi:hypothetical protein
MRSQTQLKGPISDPCATSQVRIYDKEVMLSPAQPEGVHFGALSRSGSPGSGLQHARHAGASVLYLQFEKMGAKRSMTCRT